MITNVDTSKPSLTDEYWVEKISDHKIRYKYYPKRIKTEYVAHDRCDLFVPHYEVIDKKAYNAFVEGIRKYTQQPLIIKLNEWIYVNISNE